MNRDVFITFLLCLKEDTMLDHSLINEETPFSHLSQQTRKILK